MWAAVEPGLQPEVVLPDLQPLAGVDYCLKAQESGKPEKGKKNCHILLIFSCWC